MRLSHRKPRGCTVPPTLLDVGPGRTLCREGEPVRQLIVLVDGSAVVTEGGRPVETLAEGGCIGWPEITTSAPATVTVATTTATRLLVLKRAECTQLLADAACVDDVRARLRSWHFEPTASRQTQRKESG